MLRATGAVTVGFAARKITHASSGVLFGAGAIVMGDQALPPSNVFEGGSSPWVMYRVYKWRDDEEEKLPEPALDAVAAAARARAANRRISRRIKNDFLQALAASERSNEYLLKILNQEVEARLRQQDEEDVLLISLFA